MNNKWYKVITILGVKFKFKNKDLTQRKQLQRLEDRISHTCNIQGKKIEQLTNKVNEAKQEILNVKKTFDAITQKLNELTVKLNTQQKIIENQKQKLLYIYEWQQNFYKKEPSKFPIRLSEFEKLTIKDYINNSKMYLEFGAGGSTFLALNTNAVIISVESDNDWIDYLKSYQQISEAINNGKLKIHYVNIGATKDWGYPVNDDLRDNYPKYSNEVFTHIGKENVDLVLIDGRFRVACALGVILNCQRTTKIMIHDYTVREYYHIVEEFLEPIEFIDSLAIFKIKEDIDMRKVQKLYEEYKFVKE